MTTDAQLDLLEIHRLSRQQALVMERLGQGPLDPLSALTELGVYRLAARVNELKGLGFGIVTEWGHSPNGKRYAVYRLAP